MPWFIPLGAALGLAGSRTAVLLRRARGGGHRAEAWGLAAMAWLPLSLWFLAALIGTAE